MLGDVINTAGTLAASPVEFVGVAESLALFSTLVAGVLILAPEF
jgi:hypothetical protein